MWRWVRRTLGGFPDHRVAGPWLAMLLLIPPCVLAALEPTSVVRVLATVVWCGVASGVSVVALLDWSRGSHLRWGWARKAGRALVAGLGLAGSLAGLVIVRGAVRVLLSTGGWKVAASLALLGAICIINGAQLVWLPFIRSPERTGQPTGQGE